MPTNNRMRLWLRQKGIWALTLVAILITLAPGRAYAATTPGNEFNIQVSPSPVVVTLAPGKAQKTTLSVRNFSTHAETLFPKLNGFTIDKSSKDVRLVDNPPAGITEWVSFSAPSITVPAGAVKTLDVSFNTPSTAGFSYSLAITLSRKAGTTVPANGVRLEGAIAIFCLINIDRPDAKRILAIDQFSSTRSQYQYLPADFNLTVSNPGNTIDAPKGTLFIQRSFNSEKPIAAIPINTGNNYVLPGTSRSFTATWDDGFPAYKTDAEGKRHLTWDWKNIGNIRFGRYVAKTVLIYNDGKRDMPVVASCTFWVIPWTLVGILAAIIIILGMGIIGWGRLIFKGTRKVKHYAQRK